MPRFAALLLGNPVTPLILDESGMTLDLDEPDLMVALQPKGDQFNPQVLIGTGITGQPLAVMSDALADVVGIRMNSHLAGRLQSLDSLDHRREFHAVVGGNTIGVTTDDAFMSVAGKDSSVAANTRVAGTRAIRIDSDVKHFRTLLSESFSSRHLKGFSPSIPGSGLEGTLEKK